ncbi:protein PRRC1-like isoform X3 [Pollicipes pollicipes]|nr:protein PRRC1-like isoform X3 [Pollicipes pollicipes]XP_037080909.1 protein PRRC1-like isoform X3 [Pollicipes pollicipes]XP_037080910.1 protein PRRC1-like isoform X3 [Pollicipes pollicipes]XP_037080912.1 protein PRRC1-like isoform X3 [Pollicipes pollicipes]XP_037080913.1 protein PRRC1-like isoform X3 [Pollicipes pollicipes]XP_037080914.1 protein PRRC1-like isoform X3 [Pollicipes pollicipes]XP_037080915.1 protein PRRC1-like isoform X3 [Pollicipes pollicipes]XP_037080916.1 protein PRRC1-lik
MSSPLSNVPPPSALPSFVTQATALPMAAPAAAPLSSASAAGAAPLAPPPTSSGARPLSAAAAGHSSRPRYVAPPELATTGAACPAPLYQPGVITGPPPADGAPPGDSGVLATPADCGVTVDYAKTPMAGPAAVVAGGSDPGDGWLGWLKDTVQKSEVLTKVAERARTSMDTVITTLDPQMRDLIHSGGDLDIVVASDKEVKVSAVREAFQTVFGRATVVGVPTPGAALVPQPVGWQGARAAAETRVQSLRGSGLVPPQQAVVSLEGFIVQLQPERWYEMTLLLLDDPVASALSVFTQPTELPDQWVQRMETATPAGHPQRWAGLQLAIGQVAAEQLQVAPSAWHETVVGLTRRELLLSAARALAHQYRDAAWIMSCSCGGQGTGAPVPNAARIVSCSCGGQGTGEPGAAAP